MIEKHGYKQIEAFRKVFPEIPREKCWNAYQNLFFQNKSFAAYRKRRGIGPLAEGVRMSKRDLVDQLQEIARFNLANLYEIKDGELALKEEWLLLAKQNNVLSRITVKKQTKTDAKTGDEVTTEILDIVPYSRQSALIKLGQILGHIQLSKAPGSVQNITNNNLMLVEQIDKVKKLLGEKKADGTALEIDEAFVEKMVRAEVIDPTSVETKEQQEASGE